MTWKPAALNDLERKIHALQVKLLQTNSALKLKTVYAERLEHLVCDRNKRVDSLYGQLQLAWQKNRKLEAECEHLAQLVARPPQPNITSNYPQHIDGSDSITTHANEHGSQSTHT